MVGNVGGLGKEKGIMTWGLMMGVECTEGVTWLGGREGVEGDGVWEVA